MWGDGERPRDDGDDDESRLAIGSSHHLLLKTPGAFPLFPIDGSSLISLLLAPCVWHTALLFVGVRGGGDVRHCHHKGTGLSNSFGVCRSDGEVRPGISRQI